MASISFSEDRLKLLEEFVKCTDATSIPANLAVILDHIALSGVTCYPWEGIRALLMFAMQRNVRLFHSQAQDMDVKVVDERLDRIGAALSSTHEAPFTLQRLCEIILNPSKYYSKTGKLFNAIEKLVRVQISCRPLEPAEYNHTVNVGLDLAREAQRYREEDEERRAKIEASKEEENQMMREDGGDSEADVNDALLAAADGSGEPMEAVDEGEAPMDVEEHAMDVE